MTVPLDPAGLAQRAAALCVLLSSSDTVRRRPEVQAAAGRALALLRSGSDADALTACYGHLDHVLRQAGIAGGLVSGSRGATAPGVTTHIKVAVCPAPARCGRLERARDLLPAPHCAVHDTRMHKRRLRPGE
ncbi:hypothetical protein [Streptomyces sp. NPDC001743]|uniref:hypothetical protein n=1 Tax=Streptomyces sp. NPDC001743 TaxID=3154397 RepID=UPI003321D17C